MQTPPTSDAPLHVLALNSGSSSLKFGLYRVGRAGAQRVLHGEAEQLGQANAAFHAADANGRTLVQETAPLADAQQAVVRIARLLLAVQAPAPEAVGHRLVHGGPALRQHGRIDPSVLAALEAASAFAPLHTPAALAVIRYAQAHFPGVPQVACLDTSFHARMPDLAATLPLPAALRSLGLQRYGFHGLSCESIVQQLAGELPQRLLIAHLGNGASVTAVRDGMSIDTSMGLTPSGGLIMGTRSGDLDPGVLVWLARERQFDAAMLEDLVDHRSGLAGLSGIGGDMRALHAAAAARDAGAAAADLAIRMFCQAVRKQLGAMSVVLDGAQMIVFTGGIGENDADVRARICRGLSSLGASLDEARNAAATNPLGQAGTRCELRVLPSLEDEQIARHTWAWCRG